METNGAHQSRATLSKHCCIQRDRGTSLGKLLRKSKLMTLCSLCIFYHYAVRSKRKAKAVKKDKKDFAQKSVSKSRVKPKRRPLKAPLVESNNEEEDQWSEDDDFQTDILSSARKAALSSGSGHKLKPDRRSHRQKIRRLAYSNE